MNNRPKVSVVITTYNEERFIGSAINSAINQTMNPMDYEILVVDDGGVDNTDKIVDEIKKTSKHAFRYMKKKNGGTASARNFGIAKAAGEFISFLDGDDTYMPNKLAASVAAFEKGDSVGIVYTDYVEKYSDRSQIRLKQNFSREALFSNCIISTNSMVRKSALDRVGGFDETFRYVEDYDLWCRIIMSGYFALRIPEPLFIYNSHPNSKTNSANLEKIQPEWNRIHERISKNEWLIKPQSN